MLRYEIILGILFKNLDPNVNLWNIRLTKISLPMAIETCVYTFINVHHVLCAYTHDLHVLHECILTPAQPTDPVTSYAQYLRYRYRQPLPDDDKLLTTPSKYYIELAVISSECISSRESADEFTRKSLHGLTEEIIRKKTPIALENVLKPEEDGKPV